MQIMTESVKTKKSCVSWKIFEMEFKFPKFSSIRWKALCLGVYKPIKRLAAQSTAHVLRNRQDKQALLKENKKEFLCFPVNIAKVYEHLFYRTPLMTASGKLRPKSLKSAIFQFQLHFISWAPFTLWQNSCKTRCPQKNICSGVHSYCSSNMKTFE